MKKPARLVPEFVIVIGAAIAFVLVSCSGPPAPNCVLAPPGPSDLGPATGLSAPASNAVVFDLKYRAETGAATDVQYHSFWGYGGSTEASQTNSFLQEVQKKASGLYFVQNTSLKGREWSAVEYKSKQALAFYFDVNGDGNFSDNERIQPTRAVSMGVQFITPDFIQPLKDNGQTLCRVLLQVNFYGGSQPNCMWSPAALLEGAAVLEGKPVRLLLFANNPGGAFDRYGSSSYSLLGQRDTNEPDQYIPRETLSSVICSDGQFYRAALEGRRTNGLPARLVLTKDTSPTGELSIKMAGSNSLQTALGSVYLHGTEDQTVFFHVNSTKDKMPLPVGSYAVDNGTASYGGANAGEWEVSFMQGPCATIKAGELAQVELGEPKLTVKAVEERNRYNRDSAGLSTFKKGTQIYLEPKIIGKGNEVFSRFRQPGAGKGNTGDRPPQVTITGPDGKQLLSKVMEYG